ncbi:hypothetical protein KFE25_008938 [Diacronema lutheri]|uniref:Fungal lipase-type domain-containing protein n=1 Tax=Diacronema lutheri TaxID=2081491 RepID=A0A8J5XXF8_DIALT|nr:hypothetical protein KFE25_008938 [Diacronema lutheri]
MAAMFPSLMLLLGSSATGWDLRAVPSCDTAEFQRLVAPMAVAARLTYTSTAGSSYENPSDANATVPGFVRSGIKHDPAAGGMRALVFADESSGRLLLAFRGTDLDNTTVSGAADACANLVLFEEARRRELPSSCDRFDPSTLDYFARSVAFARQVEGAFAPTGLQLLITGHSLGAALAVLVAAGLNADPGRATAVPVLAFAEPPVAQALRRRTQARNLPLGSAYVLADAHDPVQRAAIRAGVVGTPCTWAAGDAPPSCAACDFATGRRSSGCVECILATHTLKHYLSLIRGPRPTCESAIDGGSTNTGGAPSC